MSRRSRQRRAGAPGPTPVPGPQAAAPGPPTPRAPVPTAPRDPATTPLTDHTPALEALPLAPVQEHAAVLQGIHEDLARTLREAEG